MEEYKYFVSFAYVRKEEPYRFACTEVIMKHKMGMDDINEIGHHMEEKYAANVDILNFQLLS